MFQKIKTALSNVGREYSDLEKFFSEANSHRRKLVFFAESEIYYRYYEDYIDYILANSDLEFSYISSDPNDIIFTKHDPRIAPFFFKNLITTVFAKLDAKALVMTAPDLQMGWLKCAPEPVHHIYAFHGIASMFQSYRAHAFDFYDSVLCVGPYQLEEFRKAESIYNSKPKELVLTGYPLLERIYREHKQYVRPERTKPLCVIAPTWAPLQADCSITDSCIFPMLEALKGAPYEIWLRPHPEFRKRKPEVIKKIETIIATTDNIRLQTQVSSMQILHEADVLVTEHSSIAMDYVLGTERPVVWIDTPTRIDNADFGLMQTEPVENRVRDDMGVRVAPNELATIVAALDKALAMQADFQTRLPALRDKLVSNWLGAAKVGGEHIIATAKR